MRFVSVVVLTLALGSAAVAQPLRPDLPGLLHLRPDQQAAYQAYVRGTAPDQGLDRQRAAEARKLPQMTTPQRIDWTQAQVSRDLADIRAQGAAVKRFYGVLTPAQRKTFDQVTLPPQEGQPGQR